MSDFHLIAHDAKHREITKAAHKGVRVEEVPVGLCQFLSKGLPDFGADCETGRKESSSFSADPHGAVGIAGVTEAQVRSSGTNRLNVPGGNGESAADICSQVLSTGDARAVQHCYGQHR